LPKNGSEIFANIFEHQNVTTFFLTN